MKTIIIESIMTPFELARFNVINDKLDNNLFVFFQDQLDISRHWRLNTGNVRFQYKILPDIPIRMGRTDLFTLHLNYSTYSELMRIDPDVVISCGWDSLAAYLSYAYCKKYRKKYILWAGSTINEPSWRRALSRPLVRFLVGNSDACIAYGTRAKEYLMSIGTNEDKIFMGWNSIDNSHFEAKSRISDHEKDRLKAQLKINTRMVILYVGQLIERKGIHDLFDAFSLLKKQTTDVTLLIVGSGKEEPALKKRVLEEGIPDVVFSGYIDYDQLPKYFGLSDVFVLPSSEEVWGLVINEAMACGLPVITTNKVGASVDLVKDGVNGFVIKAKAPLELCDVMRKVVTDESLRLKMADSSRVIIRNLTMADTAQGVKRAVTFVLSKSPAKFGIR
jgi:glycosyltransferase involved in cell wall biosynthesis